MDRGSAKSAVQYQGAIVKKIDWETITRKLKFDKRGVVGYNDVERALEAILGQDNIKTAVDYYVRQDSIMGSELVRGVLNRLHPWSAMQRCYAIFKSKKDIESRRRAVELLLVVGDKRTLPWVKEFLRDPDSGIQNWGIGLLDQLVFSGLVEPSKIKGIIRLAEKHKSEFVKGTVKRIKIDLKKRSK